MMITFDDGAKLDILSAMGLDIDSCGYIVDQETWHHVFASDGKEIKLEEFAGFYKGKIIRNDIVSLIELADELK